MEPLEPVTGFPSSEVYHKREYHIRDLGTRSVTLFPSRAQVVRDIKDIPLKTGINQVVILGLTTTLDEHSVKIEGTGSAIISYIVVELLPNREIFQDVYPDSDSDDPKAESEPNYEGQANPVQESNDLRTAKKKIWELGVEQERAAELSKNAEARLKFLDSYAKSLAESPVNNAEVDIKMGMAAYKTEREKAFEDQMSGKILIRGLQEKAAELAKEKLRLETLARKESAKAEKTEKEAKKNRMKEKEKQWRKKAEQAREKARVRKDRGVFWPKKVYVVKISLEAGSFTPTSTELRDDLRSLVAKLRFGLSTTTNSGILCFDARLTNQTSETWSNCRIILSTSHTNFSGLDDAIPSLVPWRIRLARKDGFDAHTDVVCSQEKQGRKAPLHGKVAPTTYPPRQQMFGLDDAPNLIYSSPQEVARVTFANVVFSYIVVAKRKPAAYLQAKLRNGSKLTLLKGPASLNLNGSFLGMTALPRCAPGDAFKLCLDPAIQVSYPEPKVHHSQNVIENVFVKPNSSIWTRTITLFNSRSGPKSKPVRLTALDQVPLSEDERLGVVVLQPKGLVVGGPRVHAGKSAIDAQDDVSWGKAEAALKKDGKVEWDVTVNPGRTAKLTLEYECMYPLNNHVVNV
ncbi:hypothetical protein F4779DRAFT_633822 [Xylariaceae sp. FL0662B]|nr:hypothetical protein F4779DRAFT_633822 [Xylariaceae sp. FL0662B]